MIFSLDLRKRSIIYPVAVHVGLGVLISFFVSVSFYWQLLVIGFGIIDIIRNRNRNDEAALWSAYFAGMEVFLRMTDQAIFWELGKYVIILFLSLGLLFNKRKLKATYIIYFVLLVPSVFVGDYVNFSEARDMISFNLSGPLCLAVSSVYFFKKKYSGTHLLVLFRALVLPVLAMVSYLFISSPDLSSIDFGTGSNFAASGGYGPNQVSLILGVSLFLIILFRFFMASFSGMKWLDYALLAIILFRALVTFSRGGVFGAALALSVFIFFKVLGGFEGKRVFNYFLITSVIFVVGFFVWNYTNSVTRDALAYRYEGINLRTGEEKEYSTGRIAVLSRDIEVFTSNILLGVGPGKSRFEGKDLGVGGIAAHTEWSRMLADHGLFGLTALLILFLTPVVHIYRLPAVVRPLLFAIFVLALFSMFHAAMRLSIIGYIYAWPLIIPVNEKNSVRRK